MGILGGEKGEEVLACLLRGAGVEEAWLLGLGSCRLYCMVSLRGSLFKFGDTAKYLMHAFSTTTLRWSVASRGDCFQRISKRKEINAQEPADGQNSLSLTFIKGHWDFGKRGHIRQIITNLLEIASTTFKGVLWLELCIDASLS